MRVVDVFAKFLHNQMRSRGILNRPNSPFFRDGIKDGTISFDPPHGCFDLVYKRLDGDMQEVSQALPISNCSSLGQE